MTYDGIGNKLERTMNGREIEVYSLVQGVRMDEVHRYNDKTSLKKMVFIRWSFTKYLLTFICVYVVIKYWTPF